MFAQRVEKMIKYFQFIAQKNSGDFNFRQNSAKCKIVRNFKRRYSACIRLWSNSSFLYGANVMTSEVEEKAKLVTGVNGLKEIVEMAVDIFVCSWDTYLGNKWIFNLTGNLNLNCALYCWERRKLIQVSSFNFLNYMLF